MGSTSIDAVKGDAAVHYHWGTLPDMVEERLLALDPELLERAEGLSPKQRRVFAFLRSNPVAGAGVTIEQIAEQLDVSVSTVIRTAKELGYSGFGDLKRDLRAAYLKTLDPLEQARDRMGGSVDPDLVTAQVRRDQANVGELLEGLDPEHVADLARSIAAAGRTLVVSTGSYASVGHVLAHLGRFLGYDVRLEQRGGSLLAHEVANLTSNDLLVVVGFWRDRRSQLAVALRARQKGVPVAAITDGRSSRLARLADQVHVVPCESEAFYQSMVAAMAYVYAVVNALWQLDRERSERVAAEASALYRDVDPTVIDEVRWLE